jgi:hypothetical protein
LGKKVIHAESCRVGHTATKTARAKSTSFAHESHDSAVSTVFAPDAKKAVREDATTKVVLELVKHEGGQFAASHFQIRQERRPVFLYRSVKQDRFGAVALVRARDRVGVTACCWLRGEHQQEFSATRRYRLLAKRSIQSSLVPGVRKS